MRQFTWRRLPVAYAVIAVALIAGCARHDGPSPGGSGPPPGSGPATGVRGQTVIDAGCPGPVGGPACSPTPFAAVIAVTRPGSAATVATVTTDAGGRFAIALPPGGYTLHAGTPGGTQPPTAHPVDVTVPATGYAEVTIAFDSGMR